VNRIGNRIEIDAERCKGCERCVATCPRDLIRLGPTLNQQGYHFAVFAAGDQTGKGCTACASCGTVCPETAIAVYAARR
jgi:2-oxoglutarate ferredoxin oxidoreductase subunit delta